MPRSKCPKGTICIENYTIAFLCLLLGLIFYYTYKYSHSHDPTLFIQQTTPPPLMFNVASNSGYDMMRPLARPGLSYNRNPSDTLLNPYSPPLTHNAPHAYKQIGYLKNDQYGNKLFPIFAKPVHLRRDKWYYYTIFNNIKLPIYSNGTKCSREHGCDSLMNGDTIQLENMNEAFQVSLYDNNTLTYDPVI